MGVARLTTVLIIQEDHGGPPVVIDHARDELDHVVLDRVHLDGLRLGGLVGGDGR